MYVTSNKHLVRHVRIVLLFLKFLSVVGTDAPCRAKAHQEECVAVLAYTLATQQKV